MFKHAASVLALTAVSGWASLAQAAPVISPFAADLSASSYAADRTGGGSAQSAFNGGYWNAGTWGTHWIQADMGVSQTLSEVQFAIDVMPYTNTEQWVYLSDDSVLTSGALFNLVAHRSSYTTQFERFTLDFASATGRYLLVVSNGGASWTAIGDGSPRVDWVDPGRGGGSGGGTVPEPASLALVLGALGTWAGASRVRSRGRAVRA
jgi:hypothetical protein